ncbi:MAG: DNA repair protein RecN [Lachnospiraceae bacterium]|nr:DNA repair protein RecN [Lachnospiraceae bacterium]
MLTYLHVKNLALIEEEEISFKDGLNVMTGETGAGKSIILGALSLALGQKADKSHLRNENEDAVVEAVFTVDNEEQKEKLKELAIETYDDEVILTRKITEGRATAKINGETVPAPKMKEVGDLFLDVYGQNEHAVLLKKARHLNLLDEYDRDRILPLKEETKKCYEEYKKLFEELEKENKDESERAREISFLEHEIEEISSAALKENEDEETEERYRFLQNGRKIFESLSEVYNLTSDENAAGQLGRAMMSLSRVSDLSKELTDLYASLSDAEGILSDFNRAASDYMQSLTFDEREFRETEERLDLINTLKTKYGRTIEEINSSLAEKEKRLDELNNFDAYLLKLKSDTKTAEDKLNAAADSLSAARKEAAVRLSKEMITALSDLNFLDVRFEMDFKELPSPSANGKDDAEFLISTNVGAPLLPLKDIASGGELSRIMLALKTVIAKRDDKNTLVFDEIDAGISGRTAQAVSEKLSAVAKAHQVICISHLPQIASMADEHFLIEKSVQDGQTVSMIHPLSEEERNEELARMLGGAEITDAVRENAKEMRRLAKERKKEL